MELDTLGQTLADMISRQDLMITALNNILMMLALILSVIALILIGAFIKFIFHQICDIFN